MGAHTSRGEEQKHNTEAYDRGYLKMADTASSSDSVSESYPETFSDISSEKSLECYIVGQKPQTHGRRKERNLLQKLFTREVSVTVISFA